MKQSLQHIYETTEAYDGSRFSGWRAEYDLEGFEWAVNVLDMNAQELGLKPYTDRKSKWVNVLKGIGAHVEEHTEGYTETDFTIVLFLTTLEDDDGGELVIDGIAHRPMAGKYIVFHSNRPHGVKPLKVEKPRITIAGIFHS